MAIMLLKEWSIRFCCKMRNCSRRLSSPLSKPAEKVLVAMLLLLLLLLLLRRQSILNQGLSFVGQN